MYSFTYGMGSECTSTCRVSFMLFVCFLFVWVPELLVGYNQYHRQ